MNSSQGENRIFPVFLPYGLVRTLKLSFLPLLLDLFLQRLNSLQELQLLEIMCNYFQEQTKDSVRQIIFSSLFSPQGNKADDSRMSLLGKLVSMAVAVCRIPVLECAASWLQVLPEK